MPSARDQSSVAKAGSAWQVLVTYYLNLCYAGTNAIAVSGSFVPSALKAALKVTYQNNTAAKLNADIDAVVVSAPELRQISPQKNTEKARVKAFHDYIDAHFTETSVVLLQTKTNWNDNAQVPMLWNFIYGLACKDAIPRNGYSIGESTHHVRDLRSFAYAFVTVPTQKNLDDYKANSMPVARVSSMSGGAYWGRPTKSSVISSVKEFYNFNRKSNSSLPGLTEIAVEFARAAQTGVSSVALAEFDLLR